MSMHDRVVRLREACVEVRNNLARRRPACRYAPGTRPSTALVTVLNDPFVPYFEVFLASLLHHHPGLDLPFLVFCNDGVSLLSAANRARIARIYPRIEFVTVAVERYAAYMQKTPAKWHAALLALETFRSHGYRRHIFMDADMLCLGPLDLLFDLDEQLAAVPSGPDLARKVRLANRHVRGIGLNSGLFVVGPDLICDRNYDSLFGQPYGGFGDQEIIERCFLRRGYYALPPAYNVHAEFFWNDSARDPQTRILHFAGAKPLAQPAMPRMRIWFEYRDRLLGGMSGEPPAPS